ncbi:hypothetical protein PtA15_18A130 [Puccinia triticina]|uniref:Uncharacterized protein n=2 Tax=Puccinia triticina TaxID=208348 RepID=A0ABY7D904_9BASI|nr:uncharacterized protein PtA15_18A130 [Puccinia triticina]WAQ93073.1 hypothetical protein PtA15_18A130 [Puccinia triticina]
MVVFSGNQIVKLFVLAVYSSKATQCMDGLTESGQHVLITYPRGEKFAGIPTEKTKIPMSEIDSLHLLPEIKDPSMEQRAVKYSNSVVQLRKPAPGKYKDNLDYVMSIEKSESSSSSQAIPVDHSYWAAMQIRSMWQEFEQLAQDLFDLKKKLETVKQGSNYKHSSKSIREETDRLALLVSPDLEIVHNNLLLEVREN